MKTNLLKVFFVNVCSLVVLSLVLVIMVGEAKSDSLYYNMSFYTDMQFGNGDSHTVIQNTNDRWDFVNWISYTNGGNNTRQFRVRYHDDGLKSSGGYYPIATGNWNYEDKNMGTDVDDNLRYKKLWYVPIFAMFGGQDPDATKMTYQGINANNEAVWTRVSGDWRLTSKITGFDASGILTPDKFVSASDWEATRKGDVSRLWGTGSDVLDQTKAYPFFSYNLAGDGNANGYFDTGDVNVRTANIVLASQWDYIGSGSPGTPPAMPYVNIESDALAVTPLPGSVLLLGSGLLGLGFLGRRKVGQRS